MISLLLVEGAYLSDFIQSSHLYEGVTLLVFISFPNIHEN